MIDLLPWVPTSKGDSESGYSVTHCLSVYVYYESLRAVPTVNLPKGTLQVK